MYRLFFSKSLMTTQSDPVLHFTFLVLSYSLIAFVDCVLVLLMGFGGGGLAHHLLARNLGLNDTAKKTLLLSSQS